MSDPSADPSAAPVCYRHTDRETYIRCQRCGRPICPDCMRQAAVGFQCPSCVAEGKKSTRSGRTAFGGARSRDAEVTSLVLIAANALVWILITASGGGTSQLLYKLWLLPRSACAERNFLGQCSQVVQGVADGAWWQPLTSMFTHVSVLHIGFNMLALWILGPQLELAMGRLRFLGVYFLSGLAGSALVYWFAPTQTPTVGASGAIFGVMAALLVVAIKVHGDVQGILFWVGLNFLFTVIGRSFISWQGHLGGFLGGLALGFLIAYAPRQRRGLVQLAGVSVLVVALIAAFAARTVALA